MSWDMLFYLSICGTVITMVLVTLTTLMGIRYRRELPKLPIIRSIEALEMEREDLESQISEYRDKLVEARDAIQKGEEWKDWLQRGC